MRHKIFMWKSPTNYWDKKPRGLRPTNLKHFKSKNNVEPFIPQRSLICHKPNLFKCACDFLVGKIETLGLQWRASHYINGILLPNTKWNKIYNI